MKSTSYKALDAAAAELARKLGRSPADLIYEAGSRRLAEVTVALEKGEGVAIRAQQSDPHTAFLTWLPDLVKCTRLFLQIAELQHAEVMQALEDPRADSMAKAWAEKWGEPLPW